MAAGSTKVFVILQAAALFSGVVVPIYIAPKAFYNGQPIVTTLIPLSVLLAVVFSIVGLLYFIFDRKAAQKRFAS